ncbi:unnamed protein product [Gordionus sp. m RMFG-2023]
MTRCNVVDNSELAKEAKLAGKMAKCIHVYNHKTGLASPGDRILVALMGQKRKAIVVGTKVKQRPMHPRFDAINIVLVDDKDVPLGNKVTGPIPGYTLRRNTAKRGDIRGRADCTKLLSIAQTII